MTFAHEAAHGWWGNLVRATGAGGPLLTESLAQYCALFAIAEIQGEEVAIEHMRFGRLGYSEDTSARAYFQKLVPQGKDEALLKLDGSKPHHFDLVYGKGAWVWWMVQSRIGADRMFEILNKQVQEFSGKSMSVEDLTQAILSSAPREARMDRFLAQWLEGPGAPRLELKWADVSSKERHLVEVFIRQIGDPFLLQLDVVVDSEEGEQWNSVTIEDAETQIVLGARGSPGAVRLDPKHKILMWTPEYVGGRK